MSESYSNVHVGSLQMLQILCTVLRFSCDIKLETGAPMEIPVCDETDPAPIPTGSSERSGQ